MFIFNAPSWSYCYWSPRVSLHRYEFERLVSLFTEANLTPTSISGMKDKIDRRLLVYIQKQEGGPVCIEMVETSRNGLSYWLNGEIWNRGRACYNRERCTNKHGEMWKIVPLSRRLSSPRWVTEAAVVEISRAAIERYKRWVNRSK